MVPPSSTRTRPGQRDRRLTRDAVLALIDRGDYFQIGYLITKGTDRVLRDAGIGAFRSRIALALPWLADRVETVTSFEDVRLLTVRLSRVRLWYGGGLLIIGDAAHVMSPVGGVGLNLAIQDALAAGRIIGPKVASRTLTRATLRRVQLRRWAPTALTQALQPAAHRVLQARLSAPAVNKPTLRAFPPHGCCGDSRSYGRSRHFSWASACSPSMPHAGQCPGLPDPLISDGP